MLSQVEDKFVKCTLCEKPILTSKAEMIVERINGASFTFDTEDCVLMFKKFISLYGVSEVWDELIGRPSSCSSID